MSLSATTAWLHSYISAQNRALESVDTSEVNGLIEILHEAWRNDAQVFVIGNGGSAASASHFATDLGKGVSDKLSRPFRVLSLTDNTAWITALGNDYSYEDVFVRQLRNFARPGDVLLAASVSGNSPNLLKAFEWANAHGVTTAAIIGGSRGKLAELASKAVVIEDTHYGRVEDVQMQVYHMICYAFMELPHYSSSEAMIDDDAGPDSRG